MYSVIQEERGQRQFAMSMHKRFRTYLKSVDTLWFSILIVFIVDGCTFSQIWSQEAIQKLNLGVIYQQRFKRAVRTLQAESGMIGVEKQYVVISKKEQEAVNRMEFKLEEVTAALKKCRQEQSDLVTEQKEKEHEIDAIFNAIKNTLDQRQQELKSKLNDLSIIRRDTLQSVSIGLKKHCESIAVGLKQQNAMITGATKMDTERENIIVDIATATLENVTDGELNRKWRPIEVVVDHSRISKVCCVSGAEVASLTF